MTDVPPRTASTLDELSSARLRQLCWVAARDGADMNPAARLGRDLRCILRKTPSPAWDAIALLGEDGLFHLVGHGCLCVDPVRPLVQRSPYEVPRELQCPASSFGWPVPIPDVTRSPLQLLRRRLLDEYGPRCMCCQISLAHVVDHDHFTGLVRGWICRVCNDVVETCTHVEGCTRGAYLDAPPLVGLGLEHPAFRQSARRPNAVARYQALREAIDSGRIPPIWTGPWPA